MKKTILVVDDEKDITDLLSYNLSNNNYKVIVANDGFDALLKINSEIDLVLLDVMMPKLDGYDVCKKIKENPSTSNIPIIFLTAKSSTEDEYSGLVLGADDYIKKPIAMENLLLRINNLFKKNVKKSKNVINSKSLTLNLDTLTVYQSGEKIILTKTEFNLLKLFIKHPEKVFIRDELLNRIWGDKIVSDRTIDVHITKLRKKIEIDHKLIFTSHGSGYYFQD